MQFLLTDNDVVQAVRTATRRDDGMLLVHIPVRYCVDDETKQPHLSFAPKAQTIHWGQQSVHLTPKQFALVQHLQQRSHVTFEEIQDRVWDGPMSEPALRTTCSRVNQRFLDAEIPLVLLTRHGRVILEEVLR